MSVILTEAAANEIKRVLAEQQNDNLKYLRVGVVGGGCSGFQYSLGFANAYDESADMYEEVHGVGVVVDKKATCSSTVPRLISIRLLTVAASFSRTQMP